VSVAPTWSCGAATTGVLRAWSGCTCALWQSTLPCSWNVTTQSFQGASCVTSNTTRIATRHLTAFTVQAEAPKIKTLSAKDLVSISPEDLVHVKVRCACGAGCPVLLRCGCLRCHRPPGARARSRQELLIIVCVLFAGMHVIAWVLARLDARDFRRLSALAHSPALGCTRVEDASGETLWTWRFVQDELVLNTKYVGRVSGSAVECAGLIGLPFARLACAIPDTMFGAQPTSHCIGRTGGLCPSRLARMSTKLRSRARSLEEEGAPPLRAAHLADDEAPAGAPAAAAGGMHTPPDLVTIASTALMHAVLVSWCLASRHAAAIALCAHACSPAGTLTHTL
jgi:hypothetical protein